MLCRSKRTTTVEYTLRNLNNPIGVSGYTLGEALPREVGELLPTPDEIKTKIKILEGQNRGKIVELTKPEQRIIELLKSGGSLTSEKIATLTNRAARAVRHLLTSLKNRDIIVRVGSNKLGHWVVLDK